MKASESDGLFRALSGGRPRLDVILRNVHKASPKSFGTPTKDIAKIKVCVDIKITHGVRIRNVYSRVADSCMAGDIPSAHHRRRASNSLADAS